MMDHRTFGPSPRDIQVRRLRQRHGLTVRQAELLAGCRERIARLEEEVQRLKRERSGAGILGGIRNRFSGGSGGAAS